jgi:hypothetical protein
MEIPPFAISLTAELKLEVREMAANPASKWKMENERSSQTMNDLLKKANLFDIQQFCLVTDAE